MGLTRTVVLVGMMGVGKTTVATALAKRLGVPAVDCDAEIEEAANMTIAEIFARDGEAFFRAREAAVLARLLARAPGVLATGGGAFVAAANRAAIAARGVSVWLDADVALLWERVRQRPTRPLLATPDPEGTLARLHAARAPVYAEADVTVRVARADTADAVAGHVMGALAARPGILTA